MTQRLARIELVMTSLTLVAAAAALTFGVARPLGIALGGGAALLDFAMIRRMGAAALIRRVPLQRVVSMALVKSFVLLAVPAAALLLPGSLVDGISFAIGVTTLPVAVVVDACLPVAVRDGL
jgi:energy-converting hydrogenase Eha subunit C